MADIDNIQNQMHLMLRKYVEERTAEEGVTVGGEIPYPAFIIFVGDRICKEAQSDIIPEMRHHWPTSFAGAGFGTDTNVVTFITADHAEQLEIMSKESVAVKLLDRLLAQWELKS